MRTVLLILASLLLPHLAAAAEIAVEPVPDGLARAVAQAAAGDRLVVPAGRFQGPIRIEKPLVVDGQPGAVVDAGGKGRVFHVLAPDVTLRGLEVTGSGPDLEAMDAGIFLDQQADRAVVENNRLVDNLIGIVVQGADDAMVRHNEVTGRRDFHVTQRGNGIQVWNAPGAQIVENRISFGRDGIFVISSKRNRFVGNRMENVRFAVHYMYTNESEVADNVSLGNDVGYALMFSNKLKITGNRAEGARDHGIALNYANNSEITGNRVSGIKDKCVFIYNANMNRIAGNRFEGCGIGIHFTAGAERNKISDNAFIGNETQVKYAGTRSIEWAHEGRGNFWSDNPAFDLDGNGIADSAYRPNDVVDRIVWSVPLAKLLLNSPAVQVVRYAQAQFPALETGGVVDPAPLMQPVAP